MQSKNRSKVEGLKVTGEMLREVQGLVRIFHWYRNHLYIASKYGMHCKLVIFH